VEWAGRAAVPLPAVADLTAADLEALGRMIGNARVVALGEAGHGAAEPLVFRNRLLEYLVWEKGFTAIAIESGIVEGRVVHDWVRGGRGDLDDVMARGFSNGFERFPQNRSLVSWLRKHNEEDGGGGRVDFYGFDIPANPAVPSRDPRVALEAALAYLTGVDGQAAAVFRERLDPLRAALAPLETGDYARMGATERDALTATINELIDVLERHEGEYTAASSPPDYAWALRSAVGARQIDNFLRAKPGNRGERRADRDDSRDRAIADNIEWILRQQGPGGKLLVFAATYHISAAPVTTPDSLPYPVAGTYLRERLGDGLVTIGNVQGGGSAGCGEVRPVRAAAASPQSLIRLLGRLRLPFFVLDVRTAGGGAAAWLDRPQQVGQSVVIVRRAFDVIACMDTVSPACSP
jgi:erythromycin esterase